MTDSPLTAISSMAMRRPLAELTAAWHEGGGERVDIEWAGGVDAARRLEDGDEPFDLAFLSSDALQRLETSGRIVPGSAVALARSAVAVAVPAGTAAADIGTEAALRDAVLSAPSIGYSTGPSGVALLRLFERWGIGDAVRDRLVQARPGVPVGSLLADGVAALGFQQLSELMHLPGVSVLGLLPDPIAIDTVFSGAVVQGSSLPGDAHRLLAFLASPAADAAKLREGMTPAR